MNTYTYTICSLNNDSINAITRLSPEQIMRHIYNHDGHGFFLKPRMIEVEDENGNVIGEKQKVFGDLGKEWDVLFQKCSQSIRKKSEFFTAFGETEEEAEKEFLLTGWKERRWDETKWIVVEDAAFKKWLRI